MTAFLKAKASANMLAIRDGQYPGRFLVQGLSEDGEDLIQVYGITVRSEPNRNRLLEWDHDRVFTSVADPSKESGNPDLTLYNAMISAGDHYIVSNGNHSDALLGARSIQEGIGMLKYEPDSISTPRIAGMIRKHGSLYRAEFGILRKSEWDKSSQRNYFTYEAFPPGYGYFLSTYLKNGEPPTLFNGEPLLVPLSGEIEEIQETFWGLFGKSFKLSLAVKFIRRVDGLESFVKINEREKVVAP